MYSPPPLCNVVNVPLASGLPVTFASFGDNALVYVQNNGVNSVSIDLPNYAPGNLQINHNPRNRQPYFNTSLFTPNALGTQGNGKWRFFYGPGIDNFDIAAHKITKLTESKSLEFRFETFNTFNHAQSIRTVRSTETSTARHSDIC
jgi:hypothetical protein